MKLKTIRFENEKSIRGFALEFKVNRDRMLQIEGNEQSFTDKVSKVINYMFGREFNSIENYLALKSLKFTHYRGDVVMNVIADEHVRVKSTRLF